MQRRRSLCTTATSLHIPVLLEECINVLTHAPIKEKGGKKRTKPQLSPTVRTLVDGTVGLGGHTSKWLEAEVKAFPNAQINMHCIDRDKSILSLAKKNLLRNLNASSSLTFHHGSYANILPSISSVDGILLDLGANSIHFDDASRGFSFKRDGPLDMRFDTTKDDGITAADIVNSYSEVTLTNIFYKYGEERYAKEAAKAIVRYRQEGNRNFETTKELATVLRNVLSKWKSSSSIHPATKCFQALRIAVNSELEHVEAGLDAGISSLAPGGKFAVISFHSLEDRLAKSKFKNQTTMIGSNEFTLVPSRRAIKPSATECRNNPRARSSRLRCLARHF